MHGTMPERLQFSINLAEERRECEFASGPDSYQTVLFVVVKVC